jgi:glycosyltransferase involved in cell wall biosynthesis
LRIAGRRPGTAVTRLAQPPVVEVLGDVDDLRQVLRPATVFACAMTTGTGLKNKLLEAMACGAPAVSTTLGMRGLDVSDGRELLVADDAEAFAAALARVLTTPVLARELSGRARRYAVQRHAWASVGERYEALLAEAYAAHIRR